MEAGYPQADPPAVAEEGRTGGGALLRRLLLEAGVFVLLLALLLGVAAGLAWPWQPRSAELGTALERYVPLPHGHSYLTRRTVEGEQPLFESGNVRRVPALRALNEWRDAPRLALTEALSGGEDVSEVELLQAFNAAAAVETHIRSLDAEGAVTERVSYFIRDRDGEHLVGFYDTATRQDTVFSPPALTVPADLGEGATWSSEGTLGSGTYVLAGRVLDVGPHTAELGEFSDCVHTTAVLTFTPDGGGDPTETTFEDWACADAGGVVESLELDAEGVQTARTVTVATDDIPAADTVPLPEPLADPASQPDLGDPADWKLQRMGRLVRTGDATGSTTVPVYVPATEPVVVSAAHDGALVAMSADEPGTVVWRFSPGGTVYGTPTADGAGRIFFGAADKRLYALDSRGLFLWSFAALDSVATRPLVVGDLVIVGSEDRRVYAIEAATGRQRWAHALQGPTVSSPALVGGVVVIGSDNGEVAGLEPETGAVRWTYNAGEPVEAAVAANEDTAFVAGSEGLLAALDPATGAERWSYSTDAATRAAPAADGDDLVVVSGGYVNVVDVATGDQRWVSEAGGFVGPAAIVGDSIVAAREDGGIVRLDRADGAEQQRWSSADAMSQGDRANGLRLGVNAGGGALWLADEDSVVRRLGPPLAGGQREPLGAAWLTTFDTAPYTGTFNNTPVAWGDDALVIDLDNRVYRTDPATGAGEALGTVAGDDGSTYSGPVVDGDTAYAVFGERLHAFGLPGLAERWTAKLAGTVPRPPVVADGVVVVAASGDGNEAGATPVTVSAYEADSGEQLWEAVFEPTLAGISPAVREGMVYVGGAALDLRTGAQRWRVDFGVDVPLGGTAVGDDGTSYVATIAPDGNSSFMTAIEADGSVRWRAPTDDVLTFTSAPVVVGDIVVVTGLDDSVRGYRTDTGAQAWSYEPPANRFGGNTLVFDNEIWMTLSNAQVVVLDATTGEVLTSFTDLDLELNAFSYGQRPARIGDHVVVTLGVGMVGFPVEEG